MRHIEDHPTLADAIKSLEDRGFQKASYVQDHYRHPTDRTEDGYVQRADAFEPHNMTIGRISFWPAIA